MGEDATEGWAKSQSYNLYRKINNINRGFTRMNADQSAFIRVNPRLISWDFGDAAGVFVKLARVIKAD